MVVSHVGCADLKSKTTAITQESLIIGSLVLMVKAIFGTVSNSDRKILESRTIDTPKTHVQYHSLTFPARYRHLIHV